MRNAFVVLVSLSVGLIYGFIVPSSTPEVTTQISTTTKKRNSSETKSTIMTALFSELPTSRKHIDEKELYEHATSKQNNQSERAFIFINQKYKKPVRNRIFMISPRDRDDDDLDRYPMTMPIIATAPPRLCLNNLDQGSTFFQEYEFPDKQEMEMSSYFATNDNDNEGIFRCNFDAGTRKVERPRPQNHLTNREDVRRDFFELLKPPILRPVSRTSGKAKYDSRNEFPSLSSSLPFKDQYLKKYNFRYVPKKTDEDLRAADLRKNYGFSRPFTHHPVYRSKELPGTAEEVNFAGDFSNDDDPQKLYTENNADEDKILDKYLKDTLEEQVGSVDKSQLTEIDCSYRDCILQTSKHNLNSGLLLRPECKCGRRLRIKDPETFLPKDRSLREESKHNDTKSSIEVNYYEDMLTDESILHSNKIDDDIIRPPNKNNSTSRR